MAKVSAVEKNQRRAHQLAIYKSLGVKKPNKIANRVRNRCQLTGRPRGYMRFFGL